MAREGALKLMIVGSPSMTDIRVVRAAVRTAGWGEQLDEVVISQNGLFSQVVRRWAAERWVQATIVSLEPGRYGSSSRAAIERDETAARLATHMLLIMGHTLHQHAYWHNLAKRRKLHLFIYYTVV